MSGPTYPASADVIASQPTSFQQYNNLRADALRFGAAAADAANLGAGLARFADGVTLKPLATDRFRVPYNSIRPPTLVIDGYLCQATADVDLPAGIFTGVAATWYIFACHSAASTTFSLTANTSQTEGAGQRRIAQVNWNGTHIDYFTLQLFLTPTVSTPPACRAYHNTTISCTTATWTLIQLNSESFDTDTMHDTVTNNSRLTANTAGVYLVTAEAQFTAPSGSPESLQIRLNANGAIGGGSPVATWQTTGNASANQCMNVANIIYLNAGDYIEAFVQQNTGSSQNLAADGGLTTPILTAVRLF